ncbi:AraC family transcriptional regulator [Nitratireductor sp. ZSWI3]|uniref:AraC family transcriptional regulator n=1 Tax=Nitratireductor sp. ZSWI3 TaxID=2966359 RepID=UPI00214F93A5|nr:AraC family transcriptional regulator [Nitratireductor sp. ZSWI3]MCR4266631.1 AraC family transcriptional regulator [Nitratireductor sp. ZSWI3]
MSIVKQALWIIERHLDRELRLADLAVACRVTPTHLSHAFSQSIGQSVTGYIRGRRLSRAAERLAAGAADIMQVALEAGYGSHEAFTRAFGKEFGTTPEKVREIGTIAGLHLTAAADMIDDLRPTIRPIGRKRSSGLRMVGLAARFGPATMHEIPALWHRFASLYPLIENRRDPVPVGLAGPFAEDGAFDYACAVEVSAEAEPPTGAAVLEIPTSDYLIFRHQGHVATVSGTYKRILDQALPEQGWTLPHQPILERHDNGFDVGTGEGGISIWVPINSPL